MARQEYATGFEGDSRRTSTIIRLCLRATEIDPNYARAWALLALAQVGERHTYGGAGDGGLKAAERALALDADLAEAHAVKSRVLAEAGHEAEAMEEMLTALRLDPESHEVNRNAARLYFVRGQLDGAIRHYVKAVALVELDFASAGMLVTCYTASGDHEGARKAAEMTLARVEKVLAQDRNNGTAVGHGSDALAVLGQHDRSKEWMKRALLIDPDNHNMRYNFACCLAVHLKDKDAAIEMLGPVFARSALGNINYAKIDPDFASLRDDPRFQAMIAEAEARLAAAT
jgi:adenylate cyclase